MGVVTIVVGASSLRRNPTSKDAAALLAMAAFGAALSAFEFLDVHPQIDVRLDAGAIVTPTVGPGVYLLGVAVTLVAFAAGTSKWTRPTSIAISGTTVGAGLSVGVLVRRGLASRTGGRRPRARLAEGWATEGVNYDPIAADHSGKFTSEGVRMSNDEQERHDQEQVGKTAGMFAGMSAGARIGAAIPIPVVGPFAGAVAGAALGSEVGKRLSVAAIKGARAFSDALREQKQAD